MNPLRQKTLANGLRIEVFDESNRYFGDYHRVCLQVIISFDAGSAAEQVGADRQFWDSFRAARGDTVRVEKKLVRMGVAGAAVEQTVTALIDDFLRAADDYMAHPDYPQRLARTLMAVAPARSYGFD